MATGRTHGAAAIAKRAFVAAGEAGHRDIQLATAYLWAMVSAIHAPQEGVRIGEQIASMVKDDASTNTLAKARANQGILAYLAADVEGAKTSLSGDFSGLAGAVRAQIAAFQQVLGLPLCGSVDPGVASRLAGHGSVAPPRRALEHALLEAAKRSQERSSSTSQSSSSSSEPASATSGKEPSARSRSSSS